MGKIYAGTFDLILCCQNVQRILTIGRWRRIIAQLVSCLTVLDSEVAVDTNNKIFSCLVKSDPVNLETSGQSYKHFTLINYDSRVVPDWKIPHITILELQFMSVKGL